MEGFDLEVVTLAEIMDVTTTKICPKFTLSEEFCDILMGKMTPLLFPYLFPHLDSAIYVDRSIKFQARKTKKKEIPEKKIKILEMHCKANNPTKISPFSNLSSSGYFRKLFLVKIWWGDQALSLLPPNIQLGNQTNPNVRYFPGRYRLPVPVPAEVKTVSRRPGIGP